MRESAAELKIKSDPDDDERRRLLKSEEDMRYSLLEEVWVERDPEDQQQQRWQWRRQTGRAELRSAGYGTSKKRSDGDEK